LINQLIKLHKRVQENKNKKQGACKKCPLAVNHYGPAFIEHAGDINPKIVVVSEIPEGFNKINYDFSRLKEWIENILNEIKTFKPGDKIGQLKTVGKFLAALTDNKMVTEPRKLHTIGKIYWTHAVKCFIQQKNEKINEAKRRLGINFSQSVIFCAEYLRQEINIVKPSLIVSIGDWAYYGIFPKKEISGSIKFTFPESESVYLYRPTSRVNPEKKTKSFEYAKERVKFHLGEYNNPT